MSNTADEAYKLRKNMSKEKEVEGKSSKYFYDCKPLFT